MSVLLLSLRKMFQDRSFKSDGCWLLRLQTSLYVHVPTHSKIITQPVRKCFPLLLVWSSVSSCQRRSTCESSNELSRHFIPSRPPTLRPVNPDSAVAILRCPFKNHKASIGEPHGRPEMQSAFSSYKTNISVVFVDLQMLSNGFLPSRDAASAPLWHY